ncbi:MAG: peptidoglycan DD-metalloendopeptidase family protein [Pseudomonadota bacterium]
MLLAACASPNRRAPVEDRPAAVRPPAAPASAPVEAVKPPPPGIENAGKPGYYTVKQGDTLIRVGLETGQNWRDIAKWNNIDNPHVIEVGQVLRVAPPGVDPTVASAKPVTPPKVETRPLGAPAQAPNASAPAPAASGASTPSVGQIVAPLPVPREAGDELNWAWPADGPVASAFDEGRNKGLAITGKAGDPVLAAADGRVVYAGSGLRGYGNLVIIKHNNTYLTAYAHNQALLVKEDQVVKRGQKIAEMGSSDAERVQLHFEIRKQGKPVDPSKLLPPR